MKTIAICIAALALAGCSTVSGWLDSGRDAIDFAKEKTHEALAIGVDQHCKRGLSEEARDKILKAINAELAKKGSKARMTGLDCDGDGKPDV